MSQAISITIGRNVGNEPMSALEWRAFKLHVLCLAVDMFDNHDEFAAPLVFTFDGENTWEGVREESHMIQVVGTPNFEYFATVTIPALKHAAKLWDQDAIAYSVGISVLATPNTTDNN